MGDTLESSTSTDWIRELITSSPLVGQVSEDAVANRTQYQANWVNQRRRNAAKPVPATSSLLTPQDLQLYWQQHLQTYVEASGIQTGIDTEIKFIPTHSVQELMNQAQRSQKVLDFVVINTICFFAGGTALQLR